MRRLLGGGFVSSRFPSPSQAYRCYIVETVKVIFRQYPSQSFLVLVYLEPVCLCDCFFCFSWDMMCCPVSSMIGERVLTERQLSKEDSNLGLLSMLVFWTASIKQNYGSQRLVEVNSIRSSQGISRIWWEGGLDIFLVAILIYSTVDYPGTRVLYFCFFCCNTPGVLYE